MRRFLPLALLLVFLVTSWTAAPAAAQLDEYTGKTAGGAFYKAVVPSSWNGTLVIWNHGFDLGPVGPVDDTGPLTEVLLLEGYAVAASSYRQAGWAVFRSNKDLQLLVEAVSDEVGAPEQVILYGASLGGIVTAAAIEKAKLDNLVGALTLCGAMAGSRNWDGALDLRLIYDAVCRNTRGAAIPGGAQGLPPDSELTLEELAERVNLCTGVDFAPGQRTAKQRRNLSKIVKVTGLPEEFLQTDMAYVTFALADLTHDRRKLRGRQALGNIGVEYGNRAVDRRIERVEPDARGERKLSRNYTPSGKVGDVKIVSIHTDKDGLVLVENESEYASVVPPENLTVAVAVEEEPTHCGFEPGEVLGAFDQLLQWIESGDQPGVSDLQASCEQWALLFGGSCRFDPEFVIPDLDGRIRPR